MKLALSGASGFLGARIVAAALAHGDSVMGMARSANPLRLKRFGSMAAFTYETCDVSERGKLLALVEKFSPDVLIHAAAPGVLRRDAGDLYDLVRASVLAGAEVARAARQAGAGVVWIGSCFEYAPSSAVICEDHPTEPESAYGLAKNLAWRLFRHSCASDVRYINLRPFHLYGPGEDRGRFVTEALLAPSKRAENRFGVASLVRDFVYVDDAAEAVLRACRALVGAEGDGWTLNVSTGIGTMLGECARLAGEAAAAPDFRHQFSGIPPSGGYDPSCLVGSPIAAANHLGWRASVSLAEGLKRTLAHLNGPERS